MWVERGFLGKVILHRYVSRIEYSIETMFYPQVTDSIYDLMGCKASASAKCQYVDDIFNNMDDDNDGLVTKDEFISFFSRLEVSF